MTGGSLHELDEVQEENILVLLDKPGRVVVHLPSIVTDYKPNQGFDHKIF